jgi:hypothetical protein
MAGVEPAIAHDRPSAVNVAAYRLDIKSENGGRYPGKARME